MSYADRVAAERAALAARGEGAVLGGRSETYDDRYKREANAGVVKRLNAAPVGSEARVRGVVFVKASRWRWANSFRADLTARQVASVLAEEPTFEIVEKA